MPDVLGMSQARAIEVLTNAGMEIVFPIEESDNDEFPQGTVIEQSPKPRALVKQGRAVWLVVSKGAKLVDIPDVVGVYENDASVTLAPKSLEAGYVSRIYSHTQPPRPEGEVLVQDPPPSQRLHFGRQVHLLVSMGPAPAMYILPVDIIGKDSRAVAQDLLSWGFDLAQPIYEPVQDPSQVGLILDSDPRPGELVTNEDTVTLRVGVMEQPVEEQTRVNQTGNELSLTLPESTVDRQFVICIQDEACQPIPGDPSGRVIPRIVSVMVPAGATQLRAVLELHGRALVEVREPIPGSPNEYHVVAQRELTGTSTVPIQQEQEQ